MSIGESVYGGSGGGSNNPASIALGIVKDNWDAMHPGMVKVNILIEGGKESESDWMPVAAPYAANECGAFMMPEVGSMVVIGYINDNSVSPVVIGSIWSKSGKGKSGLPSDSANAKNSVKVFCTSKKQMIKFDESPDSQSIEIISGKKQRIFLDDANEKTVISDSGDEITLDKKSGEITVKAKTKLTLEAGDKTSIKADSSGITIKATKFSVDCDVLELKGKQTKAEGSTVEIKASGNLNIQSSGMAAVKGSMLKLN